MFGERRPDEPIGGKDYPQTIESGEKQRFRTV